MQADRLYAVSDDGHLYCLQASDGSLIWRRRLAPGNQRCIGNEQMVSKWPCRSGVLIEGDKLYTTAGMWSADGVIIYCLSADTGEVIWKNDTTGHRWMLLPHGSGYGGVKAHKQVKAQKGEPKYYDPAPLAKWNTDIGRAYTLMIAGHTLIAGGKGRITLLDANNGRKLWQRSVEGSVRGLSASQGMFIATTTSGYIYCFGQGDTDSARLVSHSRSTPTDTLNTSSKVIEEIGVTEGYCLMLGAGDGSLLFDLLKQTQLTVYCLEPDAAKRTAIRVLLDEAGTLGTRAQLHDGSFDDVPYAPYCGNCIIWGSKLGSSADKVDFKGLYRSLRPWGGVAYEFGDTSSAATSKGKLAAAGVPETEITDGRFGALVHRGPLPGAGEWTRAHGNPGNTFSTDDDVVRPPLGILWWGGVGPERIVSRHWRAPVPLFSKGHMFIQGQHHIIGVDAYTGRKMWNRRIDDVGRFPPALRGGNIITDGDRVYCVKRLTCYALDAKTGKTVQQYTHTLTPEQAEETKKLIPLHGLLTQKVKSGKYDLNRPAIVWEFLGMAGNRVIGTLGFDAANLKHNGLAIPNQSRYIFAYDKKTSEKAWEITLDNTVMPTAIVSDEEHLYYIDRTDEWTYEAMSRRGDYKDFHSKLVAVRLFDGAMLWTNHDLAPERKALLLKDGVIVATANFSDIAEDSTSGLTAFHAADGKALWEWGRVRATSRRGGPVRHVFIVGDTIYTPQALDLKTGKPKLVCNDPLTGEPSQFQLSGQNFCGSVSAGNHILAYRSTALGFKSLTENSPCYWLSEKRTSCWISLLPAGGILLAPEGASTCVCSFNYKTSLALIPVERHESWGIHLQGPELGQGIGSAWKGAEKIVGRPADFRELRINLSAPGDHYDKTTGGSFLAWPQVTRSGKGFLVLPVQGTDDASGFRFNSDLTPSIGTERPWIYSSGLTGEIELKIMGTQERKYRAVLHFMDPEQVRPGERVFDVLINGKKVLSQLDIVRETGAPHRALAKEVRGIAPCTTIELALMSVSGKAPLICALEIIQE